MIKNFADTPIYYEATQISHFIPRNANYKYLKIPRVAPLNNLPLAFKHAIENAIDSPNLKELVHLKYRKTKKPIVILIDDNTRPNIHTRALLPYLEKALLGYGVDKQDIWLLIATGTHTPPTDTRIRSHILGALFDRWKDKIWVHNCDDMINHIQMGFSSHETPIQIDKRALDSSIIIPLSDSEYHYFAGVAGSVKLFVPGVSSRNTVRVNHSRIFDMTTGFKSECRMGNIKENICIEDIRDIVLKLESVGHSVFVIDSIMESGNFISIKAGNPIAIHDNALEALSIIRDVQISEKADLVIISKPSINFYQAGKGINAASHAVKEGGCIVLLAGCVEGVGPQDYLNTMREVQNKPYLEAMQWIIKEKCSSTTFEIGIQNAVDIFRVLQLTKGQLYVYSEMNSSLLKDIFRVQPLKAGFDPQLTLRNFVDKFIQENPKGLIYIYSDYNILATPTNNIKH
ncbi:MAG: DUF2088 domain-containing protein [Candidatus Heimdallarchaeota archaeon]|nr:DUF2088 domain-containing protein [Candidatus Heimdallarchaeota archaeon]